MGAGIAKLSDSNFEVVVIGLDNSGKTTILNWLKDPVAVKTTSATPTVGYKTTKVKVNSTSMTCFDMSGQGRYRNLWQNYYRNCTGVVFVLDSSDRMRMPVAKEELELAIGSEELSRRKVHHEESFEWC